MTYHRSAIRLREETVECRKDLIELTEFLKIRLYIKAGLPVEDDNFYVKASDELFDFTKRAFDEKEPVQVVDFLIDTLNKKTKKRQ